MAKAGLELAITASERSKTIHALDRSATATGFPSDYQTTILKDNRISEMIFKNVILS
jgi:hypothetical protein